MLTQDDIAKMPLDERLDRLARAADTLASAIAGQSDAALARRPDAENFAPTEIVCHLRDAEETFLQRFQIILAMEDPRFLPPEPDRWAEDRQYLRNDAHAALRAFKRRREECLALLGGLSPEQWRRGGTHATRGRMTVGDFVNLMVWHDENHLDQLHRGLRGET